MARTIKIVFTLALLLVPVCSSAAGNMTLKLIQPITLDDKEGMIKQPQGIACNDSDVFIVADTGNARLLTYTFKDSVVKGGGEIKVPQMVYPIRLQMNSKGDIYVLDGKTRRILRISKQGAFLGYLDPEGIPAPISFVARSFKIDAQDRVYLLDILSERVLILDPAGKFQKQIPFPADHGFFSDLAVSGNGDIYLIDSTNVKVDVSAKDSDKFVPLSESLKEDLNFPTYITTDSRGSIFLVDQDGGGIVVLGQNGVFQARMLNMGWKPGFLYYPAQICINGSGTFFVADRDSNRVQLFTLTR